MPFYRQMLIAKSDLLRHPKVLFLFDDNELRKGTAGQAGQCRGLPNGIGIATKKFPSIKEDAYWSDKDYERCVAIIMKDLEPVKAHLMAGGDVVCPAAGLGTGLANLPDKAPKIYKKLKYELDQLQKLYPPNQ